MAKTSVPVGGASYAGLAPWLTVAFVALLAGVLVPQIMPGEMVVEKSRTRVAAKGGSFAEYTAPTLPDAPNPQALVFRLVAGTVVVLGLAVGSLWCMRRWMQGQAAGGTGQREMRLSETLHLGNRCSLHLVHLGQREILVGVDAGGVKTIVPLAKAFDDVLAEAEPAAPQSETIPFPKQAA